MKILDFKQAKRVYFGNAAATRDQRIQLRGSKAAVLFTVYLVLMAFVLALAYDSALGRADASLASAQNNLQTFYYTTLSCLGAVITVVAPAVGAFAVVTEKQRRSLDLVFSAPVEPKYYLVGKLISAYRYVWLLLILALPFCAVSVTLGGATWTQLFITFLLFSLYGLVCVAFGLVFSTMCARPIPALCWTYVAIGGYWLANTSVLGATAALVSGSPFTTVSPLASLHPITFPFQGGQGTSILGVGVPTWLVSAVLHLAVTKLIILGAGSLLSPSDAREVKSLRIHGIVYFLALTMLIGWVSTIAVSTTSFGSATRPVEDAAQAFGRSVASYLLLCGACLVPYLSAFGHNDYRRFRFNGLFNARRIFDGTVAGNLPFLIAMFLTGVIGFAIGSQLSHGVTRYSAFPTTRSEIGIEPFLSPWFWAYIAFALSFWVLMWSVGMLSSITNQNVSKARTVSLFSLVLVALVPTFIMSIAAPEDLSSASGLWAVNPLTGLFCSLSASAIVVVHGIVMWAICLWILAMFRAKYARQVVAQ